MAEKRFQVTVDFLGNISDLSGKIKQITGEINKIAGTSGGAQVQRQFESLIKTVNDLQVKASQPIGSKAEFNQLAGQVNKAESEYRQLLGTMERMQTLSDKKLLEFLPKNEQAKIKQAVQAIEQFEKAKKQAEAASKSSSNSNAYADLQGSAKAATEEVERLNQKLTEAKKKQEDYLNSTQKGTRGKTVNEHIAKLEAEIKALEQQKRALGPKNGLDQAALEQWDELTKKINQTQQSLNNFKFNPNITGVKEAEADLKKAERAAEQLKSRLQNFKISDDGVKQLDQAFQQLKDKAQQLGINVQDIGSHADVQTLLNRLNQLEQDGFVEGAKAAQEYANVIRQVLGPAFNKLGGSFNQQTTSFNQWMSSAEELNMLQSRVKYFFSMANAIQLLKRTIRSSFETIKELDAAMTETAVVTDFSVGDMWNKLPQYSQQATQLGTSIKSLYEATTLYYQQGLNTDQAMGVGVETMKMARIAGMDAAEATEAMTAALRGFNMEINEASATRISDVYSELAAITAADTNQIATAMSKTASIADSANMEFETTAALLAQIIETTQEAPETAGTAMKTIIARFTEVKKLFDEGMLTGEDTEGEIIDINKIDTALKTVGISLKDFLNGTKGIDDIFLELASKWDSLDIATQRYIATTAAGSRQQSRFLAMMSNYDRTMELVNAANNSAGSSQEQFNKTLDSLEAKLAKLKNAWQEFTMGLANNNLVKGVVDVLTWLLETINKLTGALGNDGLGGFVTMFMRFASIFVALKGGRALLGGLLGMTSMGKNMELISSVFQNLATSMGLMAKEGTQAAGVLTTIGKLGSKTTGVLGGLTSAFGGATSGVGAFALGLGKIAIVIGAVVGVIALLKYAYDSWYSSTAEGKLEAAQEATQQAGEAAERAKEEYNGLKAALDSIEGKQSTLESMTRGTDEWRNAVRELNNEILALIQNYPELGQFVSSSGGVLKIDYNKEGKDSSGRTITANDIIQQKENQVWTTKIAESLVQVSEIEAQKNLQIEEAFKGVELTIPSFYKYGSSEIIQAMAKAIKNNEIPLDAKGNYNLTRWFNTSQYSRNGAQIHIDEEDTKQIFSGIQKSRELDSQQEAILDAAVATAMTQAKLDTDSADSVRNLSKELLRAQMEQSVEQGKALYSTLTDLDRQKFAAAMNYTYKNGAFYDSEDKKVEKGVSDSDIQNYLGALKGSEIMSSSLETISKNLETMGTAGETLGSLLSDEGGEISEELLKSFTGDAEKTIPEQLAKLATEAGYNGDVAKLAQQLGIADENSLINLVRENLMIASEQRHKERVGLAKDLKKYDKLFSSIEGESGLEAVANYMQRQEKMRGGEFRESFSELISSVQASGDSKIITEAISNFRKMSSTVNTDTGLFKYTNEDLESISNLMSEINWSNPIQAASTLNSELKNGSAATKEYAQSLLQVENSFLGAGSQMRFFIQSTEYSELNEEIEKTIETQGELSGMDVYNLADSCESLQMIMENTGVTAEGLAQTLSMINDGSMGMHQLTDAVMAALSGFQSLDTVTHSALKGIKDFDAGMNENDVASFMGTAYETLSGNIKKGAWGNSQNQKYLDFLLGPDWDKGADGKQLAGKEYEKRLKQATNQIGKNKNNLGASWRNLAEGKDFWGEKIEGSEKVDGYTTIGDSGLKVKKNANGSVDLEGFEGMTTEQLVSELAEAYNISEQYAAMMLTDFANYSSELRQELDLNDFSKGIEQAYEKTTTLGLDKTTGESKKIMDKSEIQAIADAYGKEYEEVEQQLQEQAKAKGENFHVTDFYDAEGQIRSTDELVKQLSEASDGLNFAQGFSNLTKGENGDWSKVVDYDAMMAELGKLNIPESARQEIANSLVQSIDEGFTAGQTQIEHTFSNGIPMPVEVEEGETIEQAITRMEKQIENSALGEAIAEAFKEADIQFKFSEEGMTQAQTQFDTLKTNIEQPIQTTIEGNADSLQSSYNEVKESIEGNPVNATVNYNAGTTVSAPTDTSSTQTVTPVVDQGALGQVTLQISGAVDAADTNVAITGSGYGAITQKINSAIPSTKTISVNVKLNQSTIDVSGAASATITLRAYRKGLDKAGFTHDALVSEEGPELIQTKNGAYLSGLNGPEIVTINKGDKVYTADETKKILSSKNHDVIPRFVNGYGPGSGGGGGGTGVTTGTGRKSSAKENEWENPYDMLYNLINYIDRTIRERERIERRYERLLEQIGTTAEEIYNVSVEQLEKLNEEKVAQEELKQKRQQQIVDEFEYHTPEWLKKWFIPLSGEGNEQSDFYRFDENGELIFEIDWDKINAEKTTGMGETIEDFISKLEEWQDSIEDANDSLEDIQDQIEEIKQRGKEEYADIEERIHDALVSSYQSQIDKLGEINSSINDTNSDLLNAIQNSISKMRQDRENEKTEQNLAEQQRRLAYLKQNSAGNELEIKKLEEQLEQQQENYTDSLVDQKIAELQQQNDEAAEQRERQIEIAQAQLDQYVETGAIWQEIHRLMVEGLLYTEGLDLESLLADILKNSEEFDGMSEMQQVEWLKELNETIAAALAYIKMNYSGYDMDKVYDSHQTGSTPLPYGIGSQYATGGLADFTGPAWLDGTKSKPELVLNAQDTKNFIQLKDILGSIMTGKTDSTAQNSGDSIYDIDINIENISNDYDVERMAKKIETLINENARYRNNNAISLKR